LTFLSRASAAEPFGSNTSEKLARFSLNLFVVVIVVLSARPGVDAE
jgi:hypothetical protein